MKYALIDRATGRVENIIEWEGQGEFTFPENIIYRLVAHDEACRLGDVWNGKEYRDPVPPKPVVWIHPHQVELDKPAFEPKPMQFNGIGWHTIAQGPLTVGVRTILEGKPGIWLIGDKIPGIEGYSVMRVA